MFDRSGEPVDASVVDAMLEASTPHGWGLSQWLDEPFLKASEALPVESSSVFAGTDSRRSRRQPLAVGRSRSGRCLAWLDGRLDDRSSLAATLGLSGAEGVECSSAELVAELYEQQGARGFKSVVGSYAVIVYRADERSVSLLRDPLGNRMLAYAVVGDRVVVGSDEVAVLAHPGVSRALDESRVAQLFALAELVDERTFFSAVRHVLPGQAIEFGAKGDVAGQRACRFWEPRPMPRLRYANAADYAHEFRHLLEESIRCRLAGASRPAILLSGGLDSSPIAACAKPLVPESTIATISWVFPQQASCDERRFIDPINQQLGLESIHVDCDSAWPLAEPDRWPVHPATPEQDAYRGFHQRSLAAARDRDTDVLLTGMFGDHLYAGATDGLLDCFTEPPSLDLLLRVGRSFGGTRRAARSIAGALRSLRGRVGIAQPPDWLTPAARERLPATAPWPCGSEGSGKNPRTRRPLQWLRAFELLHGHGMAVERHYTRPYGVEARYPFRDLRLVEFLLRLPTGQLFDGVVRRPVVRRAFVGRLPRSVLERSGKATFEPVLRRAFTGETGRWIFDLLAKDDDWKQWLRSDRVPGSPSEVVSGEQIMLIWLCVCWTLWRGVSLSYEST